MATENELNPKADESLTLLDYLQNEFEKQHDGHVRPDDWSLAQTLAEFVKFSHELLSKNRPTQISYGAGDSSNLQLQLQDGKLVSILPVDPSQQAPGFVDSAGSFRV